MTDIETYQQFQDVIQATELKELYYDLLIKFSSDIVEDTRNRPKFKVAKSLNMSQSAFSHVLHILKAHERTNLTITPQHPHIIGTEDAN